MKKKKYEYITKNMTEKQISRAKYRQYAYLFLAWNALAFAIWSVVKRNQREKNPDWDKLSSTQKYLSLVYDPLQSTKISTVKIKGLSSITTETMTREEFMRVRPTESQDKEHMTGSEEEKID